MTGRTPKQPWANILNKADAPSIARQDLADLLVSVPAKYSDNTGKPVMACIVSLDRALTQQGGEISNELAEYICGKMMEYVTPIAIDMGIKIENLCIPIHANYLTTEQDEDQPRHTGIFTLQFLAEHQDLRDAAFQDLNAQYHNRLDRPAKGKGADGPPAR